LTYARSAQGALDRVFAACAADPACHQRHPRPAEDFATLLRRFVAAPVATTIRTLTGESVPVKMSAGDFGYAVRGMLYAGGNMVTRLPDLLAQAVASRDVSAFAQRYFDREAGMEAGLAYGMHLSVFCAEDVPFATGSGIGPATAVYVPRSLPVRRVPPGVRVVAAWRDCGRRAHTGHRPGAGTARLRVLRSRHAARIRRTRGPHAAPGPPGSVTDGRDTGR
jgi:hypothetical protein